MLAALNSLESMDASRLEMQRIHLSIILTQFLSVLSLLHGDP